MLPEPLLETLYAFRESRVLLTAVELDIFTAIGPGGTAQEVAHKISADPRATEMLLNALAALGLLEKHAEVFRTTAVAARHLTAGSPENARPALMHVVNLWPRWSTLTECVRTGTSVSFQEMAERGPDWTVAFIAAMHQNAEARAPEVVQAVGVQGVRRLLDLGGGSGAYSIAFARASENLHAEILDLETVIPIAEGHIREAGLADRIKTRAGDLRADSYGSGFDLVLISAICHMLSPAENAAMLRKSHAALAAGGQVVIQDFVLEADKTAPRAAALFSLNMLVGTRAGASYSEPEYRDWLEQAGFRHVRRVRLPGPTALMIGVR